MDTNSRVMNDYSAPNAQDSSVQNYYGYPGYGNYEQQQQQAPQQQPLPAQEEQQQPPPPQQQPPQQVGPQQSCVPLNLMPFRVEPGKYTMLKDFLLIPPVIPEFVVLHVRMLTFILTDE